MRWAKYLRLTILCCFLISLSGCAAVAIGGGAAAIAKSAVDRRTTGTQVEDTAIELKALKIFTTDEDLRDQAHINANSYNMRVLLTGEAPNDEMRKRIGNIVQAIEKVKQVYNEIIIAAPSSMVSRTGDTYITTKVKSKMVASTGLSGVQVKVITENGVVYLMGSVTRGEAETITSIVTQTGGVQKVVKLFEYID